jgi:O-antigen/teichoic acid export membrane protein
MDTRLRRDVLWNLAPVVLLGAVGLGMNILIARWWHAAALGIFNLVTIAYFVLAVVGAWGLQYSVLRAVAEHPDDPVHKASVVVGALVPNVVLAALATTIFVLSRGAVARLHGDAAVAEGMLYAAPGLFCFALNKVLFGVVNGQRRMRAFAVYTSLRYILLAIGLVGARVLRLDGTHLPVIWTFAEGVLLLVMIGETIATVPLARAKGWRRWAKYHVDYGARGVASTLAFEINTKLDVWMLGAAGFAKADVGVYALAAALNEGATQLSVVVMNNINPVMAKAMAEGRPADVEALAKRTRRWFVPVIAGACIAGALLYPYIIPWIIGDDTFKAGAWPFAIMMAGLVLASPYLPFTQVLLMANRPGWHTLLVAIVVATNLLANLLLIPVLGLAGAAAAMSIAAVTAALLVWRMAHARTGVRL